MPRSPLLLAFAATAALAGCAGAPSSGTSDSSTKFQGEQRQVAKVVENLESTASKRTTSANDKICKELVATALARQLAAHGSSCPDAVNAALKDADAYQLTVQSVTIQGTQATAKVKVDTGDKDKVQSLALVKQGPGWRISRFG
ncbi:MAG: nuclear transport factor 2 family protein [Solirubrobacteraceae bacterium]